VEGIVNTTQIQKRELFLKYVVFAKNGILSRAWVASVLRAISRAAHKEEVAYRKKSSRQKEHGQDGDLSW
jgi:hypothetical protein